MSTKNKLLLYNTLTKNTEKFIPRENNIVKMYTCGPTVYHYAHIGNLRTYVMEDILEKYISYIGYDVKRVMNITNVGHLSSDADSGDDKMILGAKRENKTVLEIAEFYTNAFFKDCKKLNIKIPTTELATEYIDEYIQIILKLIKEDFAYIKGGNVYFDTSKLDNYYVLSNQNTDNLIIGARDTVTEDFNKKNPSDFVLWFTKSKFNEQELKWDSPWGLGYPGWHIECSGICLKHFGEYLDIHCGGVDNIFPHHTNEIAQSESYLGHEWCKHWFHINHLELSKESCELNEKMSKSKENFITISELERKNYNPLIFRLLCLQSHYRKPLSFSYEILDNIKSVYDKLIKRIKVLVDDSNVNEEVVKRYRDKFMEVMGDDLNTAYSLTVIYELLKEEINDGTKIFLLKEFDEVLSIGLFDEITKPKISCLIEEDILLKIQERNQYKKEKNFVMADMIREDLYKKGIVLKDTKEETVWEEK